MSNFNRRSLLGGVAFGALLVKEAQADTAFSSFQFVAANAPTARTLPIRLSEIINVKDWGAIGDGSKNDAAAIQNAINYCITTTNNGGKVFFPPGAYAIGTALSVGHLSIDTGVQLIGSGVGATAIINNGSVSGVMISGGGLTHDCLEKIEDMSLSAGGNSCIKATRTGFVMRRCFIGSGLIAVDTSLATNTGIYDCWASTGTLSNADSTQPFKNTGIIGFLLGQGVCVDCRGTLYGIAFSVAADGVSMVGCQGEVDTIGCRVGWDGSAEKAVSGTCVVGFQTERSNTALELYNCTGGYFAGCALTGTEGTPTTAGILTASWSGITNLVTVTTSTTHNIPPGTLMLQIVGPNNHNYIPPGTNPGGFVVATVGGVGNQFTYPLASDPGAWTGGTGWNYPQSYGLRCRKVFESMICGIGVLIQAAHASVDLDYAGAADASNNVMMSVFTPYGFIMPTNLKVLAGWRFINAGGNVVNGNLSNPGAPTAMVFANLPGKTNSGTLVTQPGPLEGQEYNISDCTTNPSGNFGATGLAGGGTFHVKVRYVAGSVNDWAISG